MKEGLSFLFKLFLMKGIKGEEQNKGRGIQRQSKEG